MKTASVNEIKKELQHLSQTELIEVCLVLSKFKKENKELLTYLLFEASNETKYIEGVKEEISNEFKTINCSSYFYMKKSVRKILRITKKYIRYSKNKETEIDLLIHFCKELRFLKPTIKNNVSLQNIFDRQLLFIKKNLTKLHEDLQYDYNLMLNELDI
jgi:hypothetical protein